MGAVLAAASDISYSREYLREEQATAQRFLAEAGRERAQAERLIDAGLVREAAEALALR